MVVLLQHKKYMPRTTLKHLVHLAAPNKEVSSSICHVCKLRNPVLLSSSLDRWETRGLKGKHPTQPLPRHKWLSWDSNTALHSSKTLSPPYQNCCLAPLYKLIASPIYHFTKQQPSNLDSQFFYLSCWWLLPSWVLRFSTVSISQMSIILTMSIPERLPHASSQGQIMPH